MKMKYAKAELMRQEIIKSANEKISKMIEKHNQELEEKNKLSEQI
jgi:hypothetical protein